MAGAVPIQTSGDGHVSDGDSDEYSGETGDERQESEHSDADEVSEE